MGMTEIRTLRAEEIDCRIQSILKAKNDKVGAILLLYKDARVDMKILDETFGMFGWQRKHELINDILYCTISIWDADNAHWVDKQDVGTESYTEKEKGQASDSFKRAGFNVGIGRELYTSPFIYIELKEGEYNEKEGKYHSNAKFTVSDISYNDGVIEHLHIVDKSNVKRYSK